MSFRMGGQSMILGGAIFGRGSGPTIGFIAGAAFCI